MNFWGYTIDTPVEWAAILIVAALGLVLYFSAVWFVQKYTTGMVGGLILMATGFGLVLGPTFSLLSGNTLLPHIILCSAAIFAGCVTVLIGAFSLRDYGDF